MNAWEPDWDAGTENRYEDHLAKHGYFEEETMYGSDSIANGLSVIGSVETSASGNVILRVGRTNDLGWHQTEHVVLSPREAIEVAEKILEAARG